MPPEELQQLIDDHYLRIRRAALQMCGDPWEADELAQETFLVAMKAAPTFRGDSSVETWLYGICINVRRSRFRSGMRCAKRITEWITRRDSDQDQCRQDEAKDTKDHLWYHVRQLPREYGDVLVLRYAEDLPIKEIAAILSCPEGTVKSRLHYALRKLKERMSAEQLVDEGLRLTGAVQKWEKLNTHESS